MPFFFPKRIPGLETVKEILTNFGVSKLCIKKNVKNTDKLEKITTYLIELYS